MTKPKVNLNFHPDLVKVIKKAYDEHTSVEELEVLAKHDNYRVRQGVASNSNATAEILDEIGVERQFDTLLRAVTTHPNTHLKTLERLLLYKNIGIMALRGIATHPKTTPRMLEKLAKCRSAGVRMRVAKHPNTPPKIREKLKDDKNYHVREAAGAKKKVIRDTTPPEFKQKVAEMVAEELDKMLRSKRFF